jgi:hypothetical protein
VKSRVTTLSPNANASLLAFLVTPSGGVKPEPVPQFSEEGRAHIINDDNTREASS